MIVLSLHLQGQMARRGVAMAFIEDTLAAPDFIRPDDKDPSLTRYYKSIPEFGGRVLRVVHRPQGTDVFVVTAHWDRGARP